MKISEIFGGGKDFRSSLRQARGDIRPFTKPNPEELRDKNLEKQPGDPGEDFRIQNRFYNDEKRDEKIVKAKTSSTKDKVKQIKNPRASEKQDVNPTDPGRFGSAVTMFLQQFKNQAENPSTRILDFGNKKSEDQKSYTSKVFIEKVKNNVPQYSLDFYSTNGIKFRIALNNGMNTLPDKLRLSFSGTLAEKQSDVLAAFTEANIKYEMDGKVPSIRLGYEGKRVGNKSSESEINQVVDKILSTVWKVADTIEEMGENFELPSRRKISKIISKRPSNNRYYLGAAFLVYIAVKFRLPNLLSRGGRGDKNRQGIFDIRYDDLTVAYSAAGKASLNKGQGRHQEHLVPCDYLQNLAIDMIRSGQGDGSAIDMKIIYKIADMFRRNLMVAVISDQEANLLDNGSDNLRSSMPSGWKDGDSVLARVDAKGIQLFSADDGSPLNNPSVSVNNKDSESHA